MAYEPYIRFMPRISAHQGDKNVHLHRDAANNQGVSRPLAHHTGSARYPAVRGQTNAKRL